MDLNAKTATFKEGLLELDAMVRKTEMAVIGGEYTTPLITDNVNFFTKSFLISVCAHLEMCVKEIVFELAKNIDKRLLSAAIPASIVEWRLNQKKKNDSAVKSKNFLGVNMTKKEVDDLVSGNVYKTKDALAIVGVELEREKDQWNSWREEIQAIVTKRNNIVHHNDDASDISLGDIRKYIGSIIDYIEFIVAECLLQSSSYPPD